MRMKSGLTRIDIAVCIACIFLLLVNLGAINYGGRQRAKKEVCLSNLRMLTAAWQMYAGDNDGKLVNGVTQVQGSYIYCQQCPDCPAGPPYISKAKANTSDPGSGHMNELPWVGGAFWNYTAPLPECAAKCAIESGALYKYVKSFNAYRCPKGNKGEYLTYAFVDPMNGMPADGDNGRGATALKNINSIAKMSSRIVLIDEGRASPDSFAVYYNSEQWWDVPAVRHEDGTCVSFADGHSAYHKWKGQETIAMATGHSSFSQPTTCLGKNDLYWMQIGCWGQLGYTPTCPVDPQ